MSGVSIAGKEEVVVMEKIFEEKCPKCGSDDLDYDLMEPQGEFMTQKIDCKGCGYQLTVWSENKWFYDTE